MKTYKLSCPSCNHKFSEVFDDECFARYWKDDVIRDCDTCGTTGCIHCLNDDSQCEDCC